MTEQIQSTSASLSKKPATKEKQWVLQSVVLYHRIAIISTLITVLRYNTSIHKVLFEIKLTDFVVTVGLCPLRDTSKF